MKSPMEVVYDTFEVPALKQFETTRLAPENGKEQKHWK